MPHTMPDTGLCVQCHVGFFVPVIGGRPDRPGSGKQLGNQKPSKKLILGNCNVTVIFDSVFFFTGSLVLQSLALTGPFTGDDKHKLTTVALLNHLSINLSEAHCSAQNHRSNAREAHAVPCC